MSASEMPTRTREPIGRAGADAPGLTRALVPVLARALEVGTGGPALREWVRATAGGVMPTPSGGSQNQRLVRVLAERLAERLLPSGFTGTFAEQTGQFLVDQDGVVHTVKDIEVREANGVRQTGRILVIEPPLSRETLLLTGEDRQRMTMLFTPQIPASVNVVIVGE